MPLVDDSFEGGPGAVMSLEIRSGKGVDGGAPEVEIAYPFDSDEKLQIVLTPASHAPRLSILYPTTGLCGDFSQFFSGALDQSGRCWRGSSLRSRRHYGRDQRDTGPGRIICTLVPREVPREQFLRNRQHPHLRYRHAGCPTRHQPPHPSLLRWKRQYHGNFLGQTR